MNSIEQKFAEVQLKAKVQKVVAEAYPKDYLRWLTRKYGPYEI